MEGEPDKLTSMLLNWQKTGTGFNDLFSETSFHVIEYPRRHHRWEDGDCSEFYLFFHDRMMKLINNFEYKGISFKAILNNTLAWQINSFYRQNRVSGKMNHCIRYNCIVEAEEVHDSMESRVLELTTSARIHLDIDDNGRINDGRLCRKLLMLVFKNAPYLDDVYIGKVIELTGCSRAWLRSSLLVLREQCEVRRQRMEIYRNRTNKAYMELCQVHRELGICNNLLERQGLINKSKQLKQRLDKACSRRLAVQMTPTNAEVAKIMGLPKGSVDSGLYHLKKFLEALAESDDALNHIVQ